MQDYYQILGVSRQASQEEIRSAYRKLVVRYHPDRNPDPEAAVRIREINIAYDVIGDPDKRRSYDFAGAIGWTPEPATPPAPAHRDPAYRRRRHPPPPPPRPPVVSEWMLRYRKYSYRIAWVALVFCSILVIDFIIPAKTIQEKVVEQTVGTRLRRGGGEYSYSVAIITNYGGRLEFETEYPDNFEQGRIVAVSRSRLLAIPRRVGSAGWIVERVPGTLFGNFIFLPLVLLVTSGLGVYHKDSAHLQNSLGVVNGFILFLCLVFYFLFN